MAARPDVYRARKRGKRGFWRTLLVVLLVLILAAVVLFLAVAYLIDRKANVD